jgi:hypothetical protein
MHPTTKAGARMPDPARPNLEAAGYQTNSRSALSDKSDVRYIARVHGIVHAGVADLHTGADDAHDHLPTTH